MGNGMSQMGTRSLLLSRPGIRRKATTTIPGHLHLIQYREAATAKIATSPAPYFFWILLVRNTMERGTLTFVPFPGSLQLSSMTLTASALLPYSCTVP